MAWYATLDAVARQLGRDLTGDELAQANAWLSAATAWIDQYYASLGWTVGGIVTGETHLLNGADRLWLHRTPVLAITTLTARAQTVGATATTLVAGTDYELLDAASGLVLVPRLTGQWITASYTAAVPASGVDPRIERACCLLASSWLDTSGTNTGAIQSERFGDVQVTYRDPTKGAPPIPVEVTQLLDSAMGGARLVLA